MDKVKAVVMVVLCQDSSVIVVTRHSSKEEDEEEAAAGLKPRTIFCSFSFEVWIVVGGEVVYVGGRKKAPVGCWGGDRTVDDE